MKPSFVGLIRPSWLSVGRGAGLASLLGVVACSSDAGGRRAPPEVTGLDESFLDQRADPCTDFFQYACGSWVKEHPAPAGYIQARFASGDQRNDIYFDRLFTDADSDIDLSSAKAYRAACMATHAGASTDFAPAMALLDDIAGARTASEIATVVAKLHDAGVEALFSAGPEIDVDNPASRIVTLSDGGWSLPDGNSYGELDTEYRKHVTTLAALFTGTPIDPGIVSDIESQLASASLSVGMGRDAVATHNPATLSDLTARVPAFDWSTYFTARRYGSPARVNVTSPGSLDALQRILSVQSLTSLQQYLIWRVVEAAAAESSRETIDEEQHFHGQIVQGQSTPQPDWYVCLSATRAHYGGSLAHAFVDRFVPHHTVGVASQLVDNLRHELQTDLETVSWFDDVSRQAALSKLVALLAKVGFPDDWALPPEPTTESGASYAKAYFDAQRFDSQLDAQKLTLPVDRSEWEVTPDTTNAFYSPDHNDITIPVAILEDPFFSGDWGASSNYGVLGAVVGHELTHGFDDQGRLFDGQGKLGNTWSDAVVAEFQDRASCLVDQFDAYEPVPGTHIDGMATLGENLADLGGVKLSHAAWKRTKDTSSPSDLFDAEQAFFVSYAQIWCSAESPEALEKSLQSDVHSPAKYRVDGVLRNVPEFAEAFHCSRSAELAPADRCSVW
jgi:predicted metalloendopeptidase